MLVLLLGIPPENRLLSPQRKTVQFMGWRTGTANYSNKRSSTSNPKEESQKREKEKKKKTQKKEKGEKRRS